MTAAILDEATARIMDAITALVAELRKATPPCIAMTPIRRNTPEIGMSRLCTHENRARVARDGLWFLGHRLCHGGIRRRKSRDPLGPAPGAR